MSDQRRFDNKLVSNLWDDLIHRVEADLARLRAGESNLNPQAEYNIREIIESYAVSLEELRSTEEELRVQNEELEVARLQIENERNLYVDLFENAPEGYLITDLNGVVRDANRTALRMMSMEKGFLVGKPLAAYVCPAHKRAFRRRLASYRQLSISGTGTDGNLSPDWEIEFRPPRGSAFNALVTVAPQIEYVDRPENHTIHTLRWLIRDDRARKQAEYQLRRSAVRAEALAELSQHLPEQAADPRELLDILAGLVAEKIGDTCIIHLISPDHAHLVPTFYYYKDNRIPIQTNPLNLLEVKEGGSILLQTIASGRDTFNPSMSAKEAASLLGSEFHAAIKLHGVTSLIIKKIGEVAGITGTITVLRDADSPPYQAEDDAVIHSMLERVVLAVANQDLLENLENTLHLEQETRLKLVRSEKSAAIGRMIASVSHEINNPLQTIHNCLHLIRDTENDPKMQELLDMSIGEVRRLTRVVSQLREISRPRETNVEEFELVSLLHEVRRLMSYHLEKYNVDWVEGLSDKSIMLIGVPDQLKQVFLNVGLNAIEAMELEGGVLKVGLVSDKRQKRVGVAFTDTGPGIPLEDQKRIFESFVTTKKGGLGLGLAICQEIIQSHHGEITVASQPGQGAEFTVWLPLDGKIPQTE